MPISPHTVDSIIRRAWAPSTLKRYDASARRFWQWCEKEGIPVAARLPASEDLLCAFAMTFVGLIAADSINAILNGIRSWHIRMGHPYMGATRLSYLVCGAEHFRPEDSIRCPRLPLTTEMIVYLHLDLDLSSSLHACIYAILTMAFWGQIRMGELLPKRANMLDDASLPRWRDFGLPNNKGSRTLFLPSTKCSTSTGEAVVLSRQELAFDPILAIHNHSVVSAPSPDDLIGSYINEFGDHVALTLKLMLDVINPRLSAGGFHPIQGHCPRIGGTTEYLVSGVPPDVVRMTGRWSSDAFYRYWRTLEVIAPRYLELCSQHPTSSGFFDGRVYLSRPPALHGRRAGTAFCRRPTGRR